MAIVGYVRVSTDQQSTDMQHDAMARVSPEGSDAGVGDSFGGLGREGLSGHLRLELDRRQPTQPVLAAASVVVTLDPENDR